MSLAKSPVFVEYMKKATADAVNTAHRSVAESMMVERFGALDAELSAVVPNIIKLSPSEFTPLLMHLSRQELIDQFTTGSAQV